MSGSPKPSVSAGILSPAVAVEIPDGMFFDAADYNLNNTHPDLLVATRFKVSRHRSKLKASIVLQLEDLGRISNSLHAADRQGNAAPHWDSAVTLHGKLQKSISHLADQLDKAERRYEDSVLASTAEAAQEPAAATDSSPVGPLPVKPSELPVQLRASV